MDNFLQQCIFMHIPRIKQLKLLSNDQIKPNVHFGISQMLFSLHWKNMLIFLRH